MDDTRYPNWKVDYRLVKSHQGDDRVEFKIRFMSARIREGRIPVEPNLINSEWYNYRSVWEIISSTISEKTLIGLNELIKEKYVKLDDEIAIDSQKVQELEKHTTKRIFEGAVKKGGDGFDIEINSAKLYPLSFAITPHSGIMVCWQEQAILYFESKDLVGVTRKENGFEIIASAIDWELIYKITDLLKYTENSKYVSYSEELMESKNDSTPEAELYYPKESESFVKKWTAKVFLPISNRKTKINIEICSVPSYDNKIMSIINHYQLKNSEELMVRTESLEEIFTDKIVALGCREYIKYRDLWDIKWLMDRGITLNFEWINNKISDYQVSDFSLKLANRLEEMEENMATHNNGFANEMSRFLKPSLLEKCKRMDFFIGGIEEVLECGRNVIETLESQQRRTL